MGQQRAVLHVRLVKNAQLGFDDLPDSGDELAQALLDSVLKGDGAQRASNAGPAKLDLYVAFGVHADELDIAAMGPRIGAHVL